MVKMRDLNGVQIMEGKDFHNLPLQDLSPDARTLLCCLLNSPKIFLSPQKLPRDWRGIASLVKIPSQITNSYVTDQTGKVLEYWNRNEPETATLGHLLEFLQQIDRFDVYDDLMEMIEKGTHLRPYNNALALRNNPMDLHDENIITFDDKKHGEPQFYHAFVLFAQADKEFVQLLLRIMRGRGYKLCTEEDILPNFSTTFRPVARLISADRCHRTLLVYSPAFINSPENKFYMDYAQAYSIHTNQPKIIPCVYKLCELPTQIKFYHKLYYPAPGEKPTYDFWDQLATSLDVTAVQPRLNGSSSSCSTLNITELSSSVSLTAGAMPALPNVSLASSHTSLHSVEKKKKKKNIVNKMFKAIQFKKKKVEQ